MAMGCFTWPRAAHGGRLPFKRIFAARMHAPVYATCAWAKLRGKKTCVHGAVYGKNNGLITGPIAQINNYIKARAQVKHTFGREWQSAVSPHGIPPVTYCDPHEAESDAEAQGESWEHLSSLPLLP